MITFQIVNLNPESMSNDNSNVPSKLSQHQVNKMIMTKDKNRDIEMMENKTKLYREERWKIYVKKKGEFLKTAKQYRDFNKLAMMTNRTKLESHYREMSFPFLEEEPEKFEAKKTEECNSTELLRIRHLRKFDEDSPIEFPVCTVQSWFRRYVNLGKFINAARTVIIKQRLLKNLELLKRVNDDNVANFETEAKLCDNVSYADVFKKFLESPSTICKPSFIKEEEDTMQMRP